MRYSFELAAKVAELRKNPKYLVSDICELAGISESAYHRWKKDYPEFRELIKAAETERFSSLGEIAENALLRRIMGYEYEEEDVIRDSEGNIIKRETHTRKAQPDTTAAIFVTKNTKEGEYKDRTYQQINGELKIEKKLFDEE